MRKTRKKSAKQNCGRHCRAVMNALKRQEKLLEIIAMNQQELLDALNLANAKAEKINGEIAALKTALDNASHADVPQEIVDAVNRLAANLEAADAQNPDAAEQADATDSAAAETATN